MIYTVTFSPSLDYVMHLPKLTLGAVNRAAAEQIYPGGKGINVSILLSRLGLPNKALGFAAGFTGTALLELLREQRCDADFIRLPEGNTRINVKLKADGETDINGQGPHIPRECVQTLMEKLDALQSGDGVVLAGAIPISLPEDIYQRILTRLAGRNILCVIDATNGLLKKTLVHRPFLIKPNAHELGEMFGVTLHGREDVTRYAREAQALGARNVLVSMAGDGAVLVTEQGQVLSAPAPRGTAVNSVGAGDSMVAGFLAGWYTTGDYAKALNLGLAAGSASAFGPWLASRADVAALLDNPETYGLF